MMRVSSIPSLRHIQKHPDTDFVFDTVLLIKTYGHKSVFKVFYIWYLKYQILSKWEVFEKVFKCQN